MLRWGRTLVDSHDHVFGLGAAFFLVGVFALSVPAGYITLGLLAMGFAVLRSRSS